MRLSFLEMAWLGIPNPKPFGSHCLQHAQHILLAVVRGGLFPWFGGRLCAFFGGSKDGALRPRLGRGLSPRV